MQRADLKRKLLAAGKTEREIAEYFAEDDHMTACLDRCVCPECGRAMTRALDRRQDGDTFGRGSWFNYTCTGCGYRIDRAEQAN